MIKEPLTKACEHCGRLFDKPSTLSMALWPGRRFCTRRCKSLAQAGKPSGKSGWQKPGGSTAQRLPCRICGEPTKYFGTEKNKNYGKVHCEKHKEESRLLKNQAISRTHVEDYATKRRAKLHDNWKNIRRISPEEEILAPWFQERGWEPQLKFVTGMVVKNGKHIPRTYWLDFAKPDRKLYVEVDGTIHRHEDRIQRDIRKDAIMRSFGWRVLRIPADRVRENLQSVLNDIAQFIL